MRMSRHGERNGNCTYPNSLLRPSGKSCVSLASRTSTSGMGTKNVGGWTPNVSRYCRDWSSEHVKCKNQKTSCEYRSLKWARDDVSCCEWLRGPDSAIPTYIGGPP